MVLVEGKYCPLVEHNCLEWLDNPKLPFARCGRYAQDPKCLKAREHLRFCIDREEFTLTGKRLPENFMSLNQAIAQCRKLDKRICLEREWNFACEGEQMRPYPYGWSREPKCNQDRLDLFEMRNDKQMLRDHRAASRSFSECVSPFGVLNMAGNLDEPVLREGGGAPLMHTALKGGWWMPARNRCRPATTAHGDHYRDVQVGARCCADVVDAR
jgi:formylglycine-generating enzyme required for sulfatase activity